MAIRNDSLDNFPLNLRATALQHEHEVYAGIILNEALDIWAKHAELVAFFFYLLLL